MTDKVVIKEIRGVFSAYHNEGSIAEISKRAAYGLSFSEGGRIVYTHGERKIVEDVSHAILLPMGASYRLECTKSGLFPIINFSTVTPICDTHISLPVFRSAVFIEKYKALKDAFFSYGSTARTMSLLYDILHELSQEGSTGEHRAVTRACEYILANYTDASLSVEKIAFEADVSEVYLRRLFSSVHGLSPKAYLQKVRLKRAKELLSLGFHGVGKIAEMCGYGGIYQFCRVFKAETGMTPTEYAHRYPVKEI